MVPVLLEIGPITVYSFGALMALAFLLAGTVVGLGLDRSGLGGQHASGIVFTAAIGGIVGSRLLVIIADFPEFLANPFPYLLTGAGFIWYGGLIGGFASVTLYLRYHALPWLPSVDAIAPGLALGHAIGRVGCQVSGDGDWGPPTELPWAVTYPKAVVGWEAWTSFAGWAPDVRVHPSPVYETLAYVCVFLVLWQLARRPLRDGSLLWLYLVLSSVARFAVEAVRIEPAVLFGFTQAQLFALAIGGGAAGLLAVRGVFR